jgi:WS/DGAT/MGAT family acyltransferase
MTLSHRDQLSALDTSFLAQEDDSAHMHMGAVLTFDGAPPAYDDLLEHVAARLHLTPRYRQKLAFPPHGLGRPFWVDDPFFNLGYHVREAALPRPGSDGQLRTLVARIFSERLDRTKPLWEVWLVHGLEDGGFAVVSKTHHSLVDGISGIDLVATLFDPSPTPLAVPAPRRWTARPVPSEAQLALEGIRGMVRMPLELLTRAREALDDPADAINEVMEAVEGVGEVVWTALNPAPETPLNRPIGPHRRVHWVRTRLDDFKLIKNALGGTVNDVLLTVVTGALRRWLPSRGVRTEGLELYALVPVSIRTPQDTEPTGNRLLALRGALPVYEDDPRQRLALVTEAMGRLKSSRQALGAEVIQRLQGLAPVGVLGQVSRINFTTRLFNLLVTNVPGPQTPLYLLGHEVRESYPVAFLAQGHALAVAIMSYNGGVHFGLLADDDAVPDLEDIGSHLEAALAELLEAARDQQPELPPAGGAAELSANGDAARPGAGFPAVQEPPVPG